jgi:hypothetical protein
MSASYAIMPRSRADLRLRDAIDGRTTATADAVDAVSGWLVASGIAAPQGRADQRRGDHLTASRERKRQSAQSHRSRDRAGGMCGARRAMCGALAPNVRSSGVQCAELTTPWHRCAHRRKFGVSEIQNFRHIVILRIFCFERTLLSCPLLSCPVVTLVSDRCPNQCGQNADRMRTRTALARSERGWVGNASPRGTIDPVPGTSRARRRADIVGHLSESKRTECGRKADRCPLRCGRKADRMRTKSGRGLSRSRWTAGQARACTPR